VRKHRDCGRKTRRGGPQKTVRVGVMVSLLKDHPAWTAYDLIGHLRYDHDEGVYPSEPDFEDDTTHGQRAPSEDSTFGSVALTSDEGTQTWLYTPQDLSGTATALLG
jgi:hypothetical protein